MNKIDYFTHLNTQTNCNLSFSLISIDNLVNFALQNNLNTISLSERNPYEFPKFYNLCKKNKIKPIWSFKKTITFNERKFFINFFPFKYQGYKKLNKFFYFNGDDLSDASLLNLVIKNCMIVLEAQSEDDISILKNLKNCLLGDKNSVFKDNVYIGLNFFPKNLAKLLEKVFIEELLPFFSIRFLERKGDEKCFLTLKKTNLISSFLKEEVFINAFSYFSRSQLVSNFKYSLNEKIDKKIEESFYDRIFIQNETFVNRINLNTKQTIHDVDGEKISSLEEKCFEALNAMKLKLDRRYEKYKEVLQQELFVIKRFNYASYFLNIARIVNSIRERGVEVGPGRGSAVSSLVAYLLGITKIDPIKHELFFWRFLNAKRESYPDIDIDVDNQEKTLQTIQEIYGNFCVAKIITKKKVGWNNALRSSLKAFKVNSSDFSFIEENADKFENFEETYPLPLRIKYIFDNYPDLFFFVKRIYQLNVGTSTHASGLIISECNLVDILPIKKEKGFLVCLYQNEHLSEIGFKKYDFLGLTESLGFISYLRKKGINLPDYESLNTFDKKAWNLINDRLLVGIFQIDTKSFRDIIYSFKPRSFHDLILLISLNRPGASKNLGEIINMRKLESANYLFSSSELNEIFSCTYNNIFFEEQVTKIFSYCLEIDYSDAEIVRRRLKLIVDKDEEIMKFREEFFNLSLKKLSHEEICILWEKIVKGIPYLFNKAHATSYAYLTYYTAYLKANHFSDSILFFIQRNSGDRERVGMLAAEASFLGYQITKPEINNSELDWKFDDEKKSFVIGLYYLKPSCSFFSLLLDERNKNGKFKDWKDFFGRVDKVFEKVSLDQFTNLIKLGFFRSLGGNRHWLVKNIMFLFRYALIRNIFKNGGEFIPFLREPISNEIEESSFESSICAMNENEIENLGFYVSYLNRWNIFRRRKILFSDALLRARSINDNYGESITTYVAIRDIRKTKSGYIVSSQDYFSLFNFFIDAKTYERNIERFALHSELLVDLSLRKFSDGKFIFKFHEFRKV